MESTQNYFFRQHRGSLAESLLTELKFDSLRSCLDFLRSKHSNITFHWYCFDTRFCGDCIIGTTYLVKSCNHPIGWIYLKDGDAA